MSLELKIAEGDDEITLPAGLAGSPLSLEEIGALTCIACFNELDDPSEVFNARFPTPEMVRALKSLQARGVFKPSVRNGKVCLSFDLKPIGL